jgi:hypothetical protein
VSVYRGTAALLQLAAEAAGPLLARGGAVVELGVASGRSLRVLAAAGRGAAAAAGAAAGGAAPTPPLGPTALVHGFGTSEGIPEAWGGEPQGAYSQAGALPRAPPPGARFYVGLFDATLPPFVAALPPGAPPCAPARRLRPLRLHGDGPRRARAARRGGTVLVFDEFLAHEIWRDDEARAWLEASEAFGWRWASLAASLASKQLVVRVTAVRPPPP